MVMRNFIEQIQYEKSLVCHVLLCFGMAYLRKNTSKSKIYVLVCMRDHDAPDLRTVYLSSEKNSLVLKQLLRTCLCPKQNSSDSFNCKYHGMHAHPCLL